MNTNEDIRAFKAMGYHVNEPVNHLGSDITLLSVCDCIIFSKNWAYSRGCNCEHYIATMYDIPTIYVKVNSEGKDTLCSRADVIDAIVSAGK